MDLQVYAIILIVFLVSFLSYLFISKFLPHGKSFDEMIAEKKRMREEVLGAVKVLGTKQSNAINKKKPKKEVKKRETQSKISKEATSNESDASESSEVVNSEPAKSPETLVLRKNAAKNQQSQLVSKKGKSKAGISLNRNEILTKEIPVVAEVTHFEEIQPKNSVVIHRASVKEEHEKKPSRDTKKTKLAKTETAPVSPKNLPVNEAVEEKPSKKKRNEMSTSAVDSAAVQLVSDETGITPLIFEMSRADLTKNQIQVLIDFLLNKQSDTVARDPTEWSEGKSDLVQKLKKQLQEKEAQLKNEQDAFAGMQSKLKELRSEFNSEKVQFNANLKAFTEQLHNSRIESKNFQAEIQFLNDKHNTEKQTMSVTFKQLQTQYIQMKETLKTHEGLPNVQQLQNDNQLLQQEIAKKNQQILELNAFVDENRHKDEHLKQVLAEHDNKNAEYDVHLRKKEERCVIVENELRQRVQELTNKDNEIQKLSTETACAKELDKILQRQSFEIEQLKKQLSDQQYHTDESNKIEIRNLQNALDSSKKEVEAHRVVVNDYKTKFDDLNKQLTESKQLTNSKTSGDNFLLNEKINELVASHHTVISQKDKQLADIQKQVDILQKTKSELTKEVEEQKAKNNDLRTKNWKLVEALQSAQSLAAKSTNHSNFVTHPSVDVSKVKDLLAKHFPDASALSLNDDDATKWLESVLENLKIQLVSKSSRSGTSTNSPIANNNVTNNNHLNNCRDVEKSNLNNSTVNGDSNSFASSNAENELVLLQNAQLKTTVEEYKNIIAETESMLKNLESKVREQDAYWTKVVLMKDNEIENLKTVTEKS